MSAPKREMRIENEEKNMSVRSTDKRVLSERRKRPHRLINKFMFFGGRRKAKRRAADKQKPFLLDSYHPGLLIILLSILLLSYVDAFLTLTLLERNIIVEVNPTMGFHLEQGVLLFIVNKYFLTAGSLIILSLFHDNSLTRKGIKLILIAYITIIAYELYLMHLE